MINAPIFNLLQWFNEIVFNSQVAWTPLIHVEEKQPHKDFFLLIFEDGHFIRQFFDRFDVRKKDKN